MKLKSNPFILISLTAIMALALSACTADKVSSALSTNILSKELAANQTWPFADVPPSNIYFSYVNAVYANGITAGCGYNAQGQLIYCPDNDVQKQQLSVFILKAKYGSSYTPPAATGIFSDVPVSNPMASWIEDSFNKGFMSICGTGIFCPTKIVNRDWVSEDLLRAKHGGSYVPPAATGIFVDVPVSNPMAPWIEEFFHEGITGGCDPTQYCPTNPVSRGQIAVFLVKTFNLAPAPSPSPSATPHPSPSPTPHASPSPTPKPSATPTPSPSGSPHYILNSTIAPQVALTHVLQGRQVYTEVHTMWKDPAGHINIINSIGGADANGSEPAYFHYINTFTGAHAIVAGGACAMGRKSTYDAVHNKFYWYGEYCNNTLGGSFNEFNPVTMTNTVIATGGPNWYGGLNVVLGKDNKIYFTAMAVTYWGPAGSHLWSYDPTVGASSWTDYGVIYGPSSSAWPGIAVDTQYIYVGWQDNTDGYWHLMVHPLGANNGVWTEQTFSDGSSTNMRVLVDQTTLNYYMSRSIDGTNWTIYWLQNGVAVPVSGTPPSTGLQYILDQNQYHLITMMDYGNYQEFLQAYNYDMNWDNWMPTPANPHSTVYYGPHATWNYPASGYSTSTLTYTGPWYDLVVNSVVPETGSKKFYAFGDMATDYNYTAQAATYVNLVRTSTYYAMKVPAAYSPLGVDEVYRSGYPDKLVRWTPSHTIGASNPVNITLPQDMDYRLFMDYDSQGTVWIGSNNCGATAGCVDFGSIAWYKPSDGTTGEMFQGVWTGGNPPGGANGTAIQFRNFTMSNNRSKLVVSSNDGNLTVINAINKTIEGSYTLGHSAYMVEVANDKVLGVTTSMATDDAQVFLFKPSTRTMIIAPRSTAVTGYNFGVLDGHIQRRFFKLVLGPDGYAWLFVGNSLYRVNPTTLAFQDVADETTYSKLDFTDNKLDLLFSNMTSGQGVGVKLISNILVFSP